MKQKSQEEVESFEFCLYCKDSILLNENYVFYKKKFYHLECFCTEHDITLDLEIENE